MDSGDPQPVDQKRLGGTPASAPQQQPLPRDIDVTPIRRALPLSRGAKERVLERTDRYDRQAVVTAHEELTSTGTVLVSFRVVDDQPFTCVPGRFIGIRAEVPGAGLRRTPYCLVSPPGDDRTFRLLIRLVPEGPLSYYLANLKEGDAISFRGPSGRSMLPVEPDADLILVATGVGVGPLLFLAQCMRERRYERAVRLFWGLRLVDDICLTDELDDLVRTYDNFSYEISLSQPPSDWTGPRGRVTETMPPQLETLGGKRFFLVGNGCMTGELTAALSDLGVHRKFIHEEPFFNARHRPDAATLDRLRRRFEAVDFTPPPARQEDDLFHLDRPLTRRRPD